MTGRLPLWVMVVPGVVFMLVFFAAPVAFLLAASFRGVDSYNNMLDTLTGQNYVRVFTTPSFSESIWESLRMSAEVTLLCVVAGYIGAYAIASARSRFLKSVLYGIVVSPLLTSVIARSFGWIVLLSRNGVINETLLATGLARNALRMLYTAPATTFAVAQVLLPFCILPIVSAFSDLNRDLEKASAILGASSLRTFLCVVLPLTMPAVFVGASLVFVHAMGIYITPLVVGGSSRPLMSVRIYDQILTQFDIPQGAALSFVMLAVIAIVVAVAALLFRGWSRRRFA